MTAKVRSGRSGKQQKESLTGEQEEICVLSVATLVMDLGYPVTAIYSHVAPNSSTKQQPVTELCLLSLVGTLLMRFKKKKTILGC